MAKVEPRADGAVPHVLLDARNIVVGTALWDGISEYDPPGVALKHLLPDPPPAYREGDTYDPATDRVTPRPDTPQESLASNAEAITAAASKAIDDLQHVRSRAQALQGKAPYAPANLAQATVALNDLLDTTKQLGLGIDEVAADLIGALRLVVRRFD